MEKSLSRLLEWLIYWLRVSYDCNNWGAETKFAYTWYAPACQVILLGGKSDIIAIKDEIEARGHLWLEYGAPS